MKKSVKSSPLWRGGTLNLIGGDGVVLKLIGLVLLLSGCVMPNYHSQSQKLLLSDYVNTTGKSLEEVRQTKILINNEPISKSDIVIDNGNYVLEVDRSMSNKTILITDEYGETQELLLQSQLTNDLWAQTTGFDGKDVSGAYLMAPSNTVINFKENSLGKFIIVLPFSLTADILNMVILGPSTAIINPWYEYAEQ